nr:integrase, catalytic region, zinc finger, CCHC-type, peptidase aspartic, catalytic [Tanacetum cinerariifolium]
MTDNRTMVEMLRAPTEGCAEAIVVPAILVEQFELKHSLINMMTSEQFFGLEKFLLQLQPEWQRGKAIVNSPQPIYGQEPFMVAEDDETSKDKEIDKLDNSPRINRNDGYENQRIDNVVGAKETVGSTVVQKSGIQCYNCKEFRHVARECQKLKRAKDATYHREKMLLCTQEEAGIQLNAEQADWRDDTDNDELEDQELEAHYMYMAQLQEVSPDSADSGPIFDDEPLQKVSNDDHYNVFSMESVHPEQSKFVHDTYPIEQDAQNKEAQIKLYKTQEDKELEKVIELENKVKVLDNIVYKTGQTVQTMNMLNNKCRTSFEKPEFLKKAQRANSRLYDIGCYNDNLALMLAPDTDEVIRLEKESRSKLSDLIKPFDYDKLNNLCLNEKMVADLRYFNSLELEVDSLRYQLETQKTQVLNEIDRLSREYYYVDHMNAILGVYTELDERTVASESNQKPRKLTRKLYERVSKTCTWWYSKFTPSGYKWKPKSGKENVNPNLVEILQFIVDSGCSKHMTGNLKLLINFVEKFMGTVKFGNDQIAPIIGYGDLVQRAVTIKRVYYVEGLNHNLFSVGQFCDADLEVVFRKATYFIRDLKRNDLLTGDSLDCNGFKLFMLYDLDHEP